MGVILAGAATTPPTPTAPDVPTHAELWPGLAGMTWTGADGHTWDLLDPAGGILLMQGDTTGLDDPGPVDGGHGPGHVLDDFGRLPAG